MTCSICMDLYSDPRALVPCLHSFCKRCLERLITSEPVLKCPECRAEVTLGTKGIDGLMKNFQLQGIVDIYKSENAFSKRDKGDRELPLCSQHRMSCQFQCKKCKTPVCVKCIVDKHSGHQLNLFPSKKETINKSDGDIICIQHDRHPVLYCTECNCSACAECVVKQHSNHRFTTLEEIHGYYLEILNISQKELDARQRLLKATQNACRTLAQKTQTDAQKKRQELSSYFSRLRDALDKREAMLKSELDRKEQEVTQLYMKKSEDARSKEQLVVDTIQEARRLTTENKLKFLKNYPGEANRISELLSEEAADSPPQGRGFDDVTIVTCQFEKEIANVRWQWPHKEERKPARRAPPVPAVRKSVSDIRPEVTRARRLERRGLSVGTPVQRGKSWKGGSTDGGPGHIGTVIQICLDDDMYSVQWPNGNTGNYKYAPHFEEEICPP